MADQTPQELVKLADALRDASDAIDDKIKSSLDPLSPEGQHLRDISLHLAIFARKIGMLAVAALAQGVGAAIDDLTARVNDAKQTLAGISGVEKVLSVAAALLSVAAAVASKDPLGTLNGVASLGDILRNVTTATA